MADHSDVANAIVDLIVATLYPNGVGQAGGYVPPVKVYEGWPDPKTLGDDLKLVSGAPSALHVSVWPLQMERDVTRYPDNWMERAIPAATYSLATLGNTITISGAAPDPYAVQNFGVGIAGNPRAYLYTAADGDTPADVAAALAALLQADIPGVTVLAADITIPQPYRLQFARVGVIGSAIREVARAQKGFQITVWANNHAERKALAGRLDPTLAGTIRLAMPDGSSAHLTRQGAHDDDDAQRQGAYRRDLVYSVEYAITEAAEAPQIVAFETEITDPDGETLAETLE